MGVPLPSALVEHTADGRERPLGREKFFVPGVDSLDEIDNTNPLAWGMADRADVFFENSPAFRISPEATVKGIRPVAWIDSAHPLRQRMGVGRVVSGRDHGDRRGDGGRGETGRCTDRR
jgi:hypothetical protein